MATSPGMLDTFAARQFAKDESGRLVFLPRGGRHTGYYISDSDESKFKSLVKVYGLGGMLINLTGSTASIALTLALVIDDRSEPLASRLRFGIVLYLICAVLLYLGPALIFWNMYRGVLARLCSSLTAVEPTVLRLTPLPSNQRRSAIILVVLALLIFVLILGVLISYRR
jgi:hypothetical protein